MVSEAAVMLAQGTAQCGHGGVMTSAMAFGGNLIDQLHARTCLYARLYPLLHSPSPIIYILHRTFAISNRYATS